MNNKGYAFIETIIMILVLTSSLLLIYFSYKNIFNTEKNRLYYDDPAYIYKSYFTLKELLNVEYFKNLNFKNNSLVLEYTLDQEKMSTYKSAYDIAKIYIIKPSIQTLLECKSDYLKGECATTTCELCKYSYQTFDEESLEYFKTLGSIKTDNYVFIFKYNETNCKDTDICNKYFVWLDSGVKYE